MSIHTFDTVSDLIMTVKARIDSIDVLSIDMFDTLLVRRVHDPDLVKNATTRFIHSLAQQQDLWSSFALVEKARNEIEASHRKNNGENFPDYEANYQHFMPEVLDSIFANSPAYKGKFKQELLIKVTDYEIQIESAMLVARAEFVAFLEYLKEHKKRVFLLSDIYLPSELLTRLLADKSLDHYFEAIVSSADSFQAKASGAGFSLLEENYSLDKAHWVHIGDNPWSDGEKPTEFGIDAYVITDVQEAKRKQIAKRYDYLARKQPIWVGRNIQQIMLPLEGENIERSALYADGYQFFAYLFGSMLFKLKSRVDELGIKKLYFCAREGWMLKKCWELMAPILWPQDSEKYELHYLYVSRLSLGKASRANVGLRFDDIENALRPVNNKDFTDVARVYGLNIDSLEPYLTRYDLTAEMDISALGRSNETFKKLLKLCDDFEFNQAIREQTQNSNDALCAYLEESNFLSKNTQHDNDIRQQRVALIDIGWVGTIQSSLNQAIKHRQGDRPIIHGFLMASNANANLYPESHHSQIEGLLYDDSQFSTVPSILNSCKDIFEEVTRASHPTLLDYLPCDSTGGNSASDDLPSHKKHEKSVKGYTLTFRSEQHDSFAKEMAQFDHYADLHAGVFDGVTQFAAAVAIHKYKANFLQAWCDVLILGKLGLPSYDEISRLKNEYHQDDFARQDQQRKLSRKIQKQITAEQTVWNYSSEFLKKSLLAKLYFLNRFVKKSRRR